MQEKTNSYLFKKIDCFFVRSGGLIAMTNGDYDTASKSQAMTEDGAMISSGQSEKRNAFTDHVSDSTVTELSIV